MPLTLDELLQRPPVFLNVGVHAFGESLRDDGFEVVDVEWSPPAGGDVKIAELLDDLL